MIERMIAGLGGVLAEAGPNNAPENNPEWGKAAPTGLFVLLVFVVACYFLFRSMNRHIKDVPADFAAPSAQAGDDHLGDATALVPVAESGAVREQTPPRLGTPEAMLAEQKAKRQQKVRRARERARRDDA